MIKKITYYVKFPFGASFNKPLQYIILKRIYKDIKHKTCLNNSFECAKCTKSNDCVYYFLSGNNFKNYPAILVRKDFIETSIFSKTNQVKIEFYLLGCASIYSTFIDEFLRETNKIFGSYLIKIKDIDEVMDENEDYSGNICFETPFSQESATAQIKYYNDTYKTSFSIPHIKIDSKQMMQYNDNTNYIFENKKYQVQGVKGRAKVESFPKALMMIGIGLSNIIGGGRSRCE